MNKERKLIIAGNWKMNKTVAEALALVKGLKLELVAKEAGKAYELVARLDELPASTVSGNVSFETSVAAQSRIEVPVIVNVFKP